MEKDNPADTIDTKSGKTQRNNRYTALGKLQARVHEESSLVLWINGIEMTAEAERGFQGRDPKKNP